MPSCDLCETLGGTLLWQNSVCRVVLVEGAEASAFPGFCRVVWKTHVREMADLTSHEQQALMAVVFATEAVIQKLYQPHKINIASLGNVTPHLHWHIIPRYERDSHFPRPIWAEPLRTGNVELQIDVAILCQALQTAISALNFSL